MLRSRTVFTSLLLALLAGMLAPARGNAEDVGASFSIGGDGIVIGEPAISPDPANCVGPNSVLTALITLTNGSAMAESATITVALQPGLHFDPTATCDASLGTCTILGPTALQWTLQIPAQSIEFARYALRVDADVPLGSQVCQVVTATIGTDEPVMITSCSTTNSARQCGLGAPALAETSVVLLILALAAGGMLLLSRRQS